MSTGIEFSVSRVFKVGGRSFTIPTGSLTYDSVVSYSGTIDAGTTNLHRFFNAKVAQMTGVGIKATKAVTIKVNSSSAPDQTLTIPDSGGIVWIKGDVASNPLLEDVTDLYITNAGSSSSDVEFHVQVNQPGVGS